MMNCGYDPRPVGRYDLPPIAPQLWHAYHIAGEQLAVGIVAALLHRLHRAKGRTCRCAVHEAVSKNTELDLMSWVMRRAPLYRQTCRHAVETPSRSPSISHTKDGRWCMTWGVSARDKANLVPFLERYGMAADLQPPARGRRPQGPQRARLGGDRTNGPRTSLDVIQRFVRAYTYDDVPWREAQDAGLLWAPLRKPHENAARPALAGSAGPSPTSSIPSSGAASAIRSASGSAPRRAGRSAAARRCSARTRQRCWRRFGAGAEHPRVPARPARRGAGAAVRARQAVPAAGRAHLRLLLVPGLGRRHALRRRARRRSASRWSGRTIPTRAWLPWRPVGGRAAREAATGPLQRVTDSDMGGQFNNKNAGKRGMSLNIRHPKGLAIAKELVAQSRRGRGGLLARRARAPRPRLRRAASRSGPTSSTCSSRAWAARARYGRFRTVGPVAASFAGTTDMSGLPEPAMPAGWGYSYLDWMGAYGFALAMLGALYHRERTGEGPVDRLVAVRGGHLPRRRAGARLVGQRPAVDAHRQPLALQAGRAAWRLPLRGRDRWLAIACFDEAEWRGAAHVAGLPALRDDPRFAHARRRAWRTRTRWTRR